MVTLSVAVDAASRLRLSPVVLHPDVRIAGGRAVRRVLERGGLVLGYPEFRAWAEMANPTRPQTAGGVVGDWTLAAPPVFKPRSVAMATESRS